jgi:hypothetical protein
LAATHPPDLPAGRVGRLQGRRRLRYRICLRTFSAAESADATPYRFAPFVYDVAPATSYP